MRQPGNTVLVLRLLMNKSPMRRICEVADISPRTLYQRIDLLHDQLARLAAQHERLLLDGKAFPRMHLAVDRQDHAFNWGSHLDRRTVALRAIASAEVKTGYVLAQHLNYDPDVDPWEAEIDARAAGNRDQPQLAFHKWALIRLPSHYERNADELSRIDPSTAAPARGVQVHESYSMVAHFLFLERLLRGVEKLQFSLDQEPLIRMACLLSFADRVRAGQVLAYFVRIDKDLTVEERKAELSRAALAFERARQAAPDGDDFFFAASHFRAERERLLAAWIFRFMRSHRSGAPEASVPEGVKPPQSGSHGRISLRADSTSEHCLFLTVSRVCFAGLWPPLTRRLSVLRLEQRQFVARYSGGFISSGTVASHEPEYPLPACRGAIDGFRTLCHR